jgi:hypothetical protein
MTITFPRTDILTAVRFADQTLTLVSRQELSTMANGSVRGKDFGPALWSVQYKTVPLNSNLGVTYEAMLNSLDGVIHPFEAGDLRRKYPLAYPTGAFTDSGQINSINANNKAVSFKNLPANFALSVGDYFSFDYSNGTGTCRALHQIMESVTANSGGTTTEVEIRPFLRPGLTVSTPVTFKTPRGRFTLLPNSVTPVLSTGFLTTVTFKAVQDTTASS